MYRPPSTRRIGPTSPGALLPVLGATLGGAEDSIDITAAVDAEARRRHPRPEGRLAGARETAAIRARGRVTKH